MELRITDEMVEPVIAAMEVAMWWDFTEDDTVRDEVRKLMFRVTERERIANGRLPRAR
jgi:hypothetical protein